MNWLLVITMWAVSMGVFAPPGIIQFRVSWVEPIQVDSTIVSIFASSDPGTPLYRARHVSPATILLRSANDTTNYQFELRSYKGGTAGSAGFANFYFDATKYYKLDTIIIRPNPIVTVVGGQVQLCWFARFNDGSIVGPVGACLPCGTYFIQFPDSVRVISGFKQRVTDTLSVSWQDALSNGAVTSACSSQ